MIEKIIVALVVAGAAAFVAYWLVSSSRKPKCDCHESQACPFAGNCPGPGDCVNRSYFEKSGEGEVKERPESGPAPPKR